MYVQAGNMNLSGVSKNKRIFTFTPNSPSLDTSEWSENKKVWLLAYFEGLTSVAI